MDAWLSSFGDLEIPAPSTDPLPKSSIGVFPPDSTAPLAAADLGIQLRLRAEWFHDFEYALLHAPPSTSWLDALSVIVDRNHKTAPYATLRYSTIAALVALCHRRKAARLAFELCRHAQPAERYSFEFERAMYFGTWQEALVASSRTPKPHFSFMRFYEERGVQEVDPNAETLWRAAIQVQSQHSQTSMEHSRSLLRLICKTSPWELMLATFYHGMAPTTQDDVASTVLYHAGRGGAPWEEILKCFAYCVIHGRRIAPNRRTPTLNGHLAALVVAAAQGGLVPRLCHHLVRTSRPDELSTAMRGLKPSQWEAGVQVMRAVLGMDPPDPQALRSACEGFVHNFLSVEGRLSPLAVVVCAEARAKGGGPLEPLMYQKLYTELRHMHKWALACELYVGQIADIEMVRGTVTSGDILLPLLAILGRVQKEKEALQVLRNHSTIFAAHASHILYSFNRQLSWRACVEALDVLRNQQTLTDPYHAFLHVTHACLYAGQWTAALHVLQSVPRQVERAVLRKFMLGVTRADRERFLISEGESSVGDTSSVQYSDVVRYVMSREVQGQFLAV